MATIVAQRILQSGLIPAYSAASAGGDKLVNTGIQYFHVKNDSGVTITANVVPIVTVFIDPVLGKLIKQTASLVLTAGQSGFLGPFETGAFNDTQGFITITCTATASVTIAALYI
jgi:hypothetical protein